MPIVFEQPQPLSPSTSYGYGQTEQFNQTFPTFSQNAARIAELYAQGASRGGSMGGAALAQQANAAQTAAIQREQARGQEAQQFTAGQQGQLNDIYARGEVQSALQSQDMTQAEFMRMNRLQQAVSAIGDQVQNGRLSPEEGQALMLQAQTGLNPLQQKLQAQQVKQEQMQTQKLMHQAALAATVDMVNKKVASGQVDAIPKTVNPADGRAYTLIPDHNGKLYNPFQEIDELNAKMAAEQAKAGSKTLPVEDELKNAQYEQTLRKEHHALVSDIEKQVRADEKAKNWTDAEIQNEVTRRKMQRGIPPTADNYVDRYSPRRTLSTGGAEVAAESPAAATEPRGLPPEVEKEQKPFEPGRPKTPEQIRDVNRYRAWTDKVQGRLDLTTAQRTMYVTAARDAESLLAKYGSVARMKKESPEDYAAYVRIGDTLSTLPDQPAPPAPPPQPPRPQQGPLQPQQPGQAPTSGTGWVNPFAPLRR